MNYIILSNGTIEKVQIFKIGNLRFETRYCYAISTTISLNKKNATGELSMANMLYFTKYLQVLKV